MGNWASDQSETDVYCEGHNRLSSNPWEPHYTEFQSMEVHVRRRHRKRWLRYTMETSCREVQRTVRSSLKSSKTHLENPNQVVNNGSWHGYLKTTEFRNGVKTCKLYTKWEGSYLRERWFRILCFSQAVHLYTLHKLRNTSIRSTSI